MSMSDSGFSIQAFLLGALEVFSFVLLLLFGVAFLAVIVTYIYDVTQTKTAIRRNYPVIGHFRYFFEHLGEFFRQYFFAMDREELPFNRAQRAWVYRAGKDLPNTVAFGSTRDIRRPGSILFVNCPFPTLGEDAVPPGPITIGEKCRHPYTTDSLFNISGMSYGALSKPAVQALSMGAHKAGCWINTGEGGLSPYHLQGGADIVFQIGTAKNGVRDPAGNLSDDRLREVAALPQVKMFEIKLSQGAKPGKGGILPGKKVTDEIAAIRGIEAGKDAISPNRHTDVRCNNDLLDMIQQVREVTGKPVGFKIVIGGPHWLDELFSDITKRGPSCAPDFITLDGSDGGTGAAPMPLIDAVGLSLRESLYLLVDKLNAHGLRDRVKVVASGKLITPADIAWALCVGADFVTSARGFMFALGCIQALQCNKNTCPTGITTHDPNLQKGLVPEVKAERVANYVGHLVHEVGVIAHSCGVKSPRELRRHHARIVTVDGPSVALDERFPPVRPPKVHAVG
ncbi:MAG: FMN-binding glutamate synthase family protein [Candidatus Thiodiazotropha sp. (ex Dulcina madagascariensis)]|nr:FMN-binding glutamate synthase family protein [Candidatus Thiodiazotropha sp. (ex Dulcina madagascariensis)]MCU7927232.1 FMN-binding glutamate synthase family protein [Candidatus Thiodiazotropha sp. (ex Dulcina madagascariensis)]